MNKFFILFFILFFCLPAKAEDRPAVLSIKEPKSTAKVRVVTAQGEETIEETKQERVKMLPPDEDENLIKELLDTIVESMRENDLRKYSSCFTKEFMSKRKSKTALMFLEDNLDLTVEKFQIVDSDESQIEFVLKYKIRFGENEFATVSNVFAKKEVSGLIVNKEDVISQKQKADQQTPIDFRVQKNPAFFGEENPQLLDGNGDVPDEGNVPDNCPNGKCKFAPKNPKVERKPKKEFSLFNDANGNPDPNGPMWLPIETLMEAYPEDYKNCGCMKNR